MKGPGLACAFSYLLLLGPPLTITGLRGLPVQGLPRKPPCLPGASKVLAVRASFPRPLRLQPHHLPVLVWMGVGDRPSLLRVFTSPGPQTLSCKGCWLGGREGPGNWGPGIRVQWEATDFGAGGPGKSVRPAVSMWVVLCDPAVSCTARPSCPHPPGFMGCGREGMLIAEGCDRDSDLWDLGPGPRRSVIGDWTGFPIPP